MPDSVAAIVVDHNAGPLLGACVRSLLDDGAGPIVVVENGRPESASTALSDLESQHGDGVVSIVRPERNLGYGSGVNRGLAALAGEHPEPEWVLVCNADLRMHAGALGHLRQALADHPTWALVGPRIFNEDGSVYPSVRCFPGLADAAGHALLAQLKPDNRFTQRYSSGAPSADDAVDAEWVSGSCFLARRQALEELGGFDEAYFMYAEDMDLCWRAHQAGWRVGFAGAASITHVQGAMTAQHPYRMMMAHHRSALRFANRTTSGWRRIALPLAVVVLGLRMAVSSIRLAAKR